VLTQPDDGPSDEPVDLTGFTIVTKKGSTSTGGGFTSAQGTSKQAVHDPNAAVGGTPGGHGTGPPRPPPPPKPARNLSRSAMPRGSTSWSGCPFPPQADLEQIHRAVVEIVVTVGADGRPQAVRVVKDPGYGFAGQARQCALGRSYEPALDVDGRSVAGTTPLLRITFRR
jgi:protein TonB